MTDRQHARKTEPSSTLDEAMTCGHNPHVPIVLPASARDRLRELVEEIKRERELSTQKQVAEKVFEMSEAHLSRLLNEKRPLVEVALVQIAKKVGFSFEYFLSLEPSSYRDFRRGPLHVLAGTLGTRRLSEALHTADMLLRERGGDQLPEPEIAEQLATEILALDFVRKAFELLDNSDKNEHRWMGIPLALSLRRALEDDDVIARIARKATTGAEARTKK